MTRLHNVVGKAWHSLVVTRHEADQGRGGPQAYVQMDRQQNRKTGSHLQADTWHGGRFVSLANGGVTLHKPQSQSTAANHFRSPRPSAMFVNLDCALPGLRAVAAVVRLRQQSFINMNGAARTKAYRRHGNTSQSCIPPSVACKQHHEAVTSDSAADLKHELTRPPATLWQLARTSSCCPCVWNWSPGFLQVLRRCRTHSPCWRWLQPVGRLPLNHHKSQP